MTIKHTTSRTMIALLTWLFTLSMLAASAWASPSKEGDRWSLSAGLEVDLGTHRDPADRDDYMSGRTSGPSVGLQYWHYDWLATEAQFLLQSDSSAMGSHDYESSAWRMKVGSRIALPSVISPISPSASDMTVFSPTGVSYPVVIGVSEKELTGSTA